jgi:hypothetical protein
LAESACCGNETTFPKDRISTRDDQGAPTALFFEWMNAFEPCFQPVQSSSMQVGSAGGVALSERALVLSSLLLKRRLQTSTSVSSALSGLGTVRKWSGPHCEACLPQVLHRRETGFKVGLHLSDFEQAVQLFCMKSLAICCDAQLRDPSSEHWLAPTHPKLTHFNTSTHRAACSLDLVSFGLVFIESLVFLG